MTRADSAEVVWDPRKKGWVVRIRIGEEVVKRPGPKKTAGADDEALKRMAVEIAKDDGYELEAARVAVAR